MQPTSHQIDRRYIVQRMLGQGGMGLFIKPLTASVVRMSPSKKLSFHPGELTGTPGSDTDFRIAFSDEFLTLASLRHPNIISVLDYGFEDKQPYFTMELTLQKPSLKPVKMHYWIPKLKY
jgi:eukaryotic-like serine/threonine-protein kinase